MSDAAALDVKIKKTQEELKKYEKMLLGDTQQADPELVEKTDKLAKYLIKYENYLRENHGEFKNTTPQRTKELLEKKDSILMKRKSQYKQLNAELDEKDAEFQKTKERLKKRKQRNKEIQQRNDEFLQNNESVLKQLRHKRRQVRKFSKFIINFKSNFEEITLSFRKDFKHWKKELKSQLKDFLSQYSQIRTELNEQLDAKVSRLSKKYSKEKTRTKEEIEELKQKIQEAKNMLSNKADQKSALEKKRKEEFERVQKEKSDILARRKKITKDVYDKWKNIMEVRIPRYELSVTLPEITSKLDLMQSVMPKILKSAETNIKQCEESINQRNMAPGEVYEKITFITVTPPGISDYIEKRKKALSYCYSPAEIKYFLYGEEKLKEMFIKKKKQRDDSRARQASEKKRLQDEYNIQYTQSKANITRLLNQAHLPPIDIPTFEDVVVEEKTQDVKSLFKGSMTK